MLPVLRSGRILTSQRCLFEKLSNFKYFRTSCIAFLRIGDEKRDKKKQAENEETQKKIDEILKLSARNTKYIIAFAVTMIFAYILLNGTKRGNRKIPRRLQRAVKWNDFIREMLAKGEVEKLIVNRQNNLVIVKLYEGSIVRDQDPVNHPNEYYMEIPSVIWFEDNLRQVEASLGIPPGKGVVVEYDQPNVS